MAATIQLSGIDQGFLAKLMGADGPNGIATTGEVPSEAFQQQLRQFLDEVRNSPDKLSPELQALLAQLLNSGNGLPDLSTQVAADGTTLPPFAALAQALGGSVSGGEGAGGNLPGQPTLGTASSGASDAVESLQQLLGEPEAKLKLDNVLSGSVRKDFEALLNQLADRAQAVVQPAAASTLGGPVPTSAQGGPLLSQNLLSMPVPQQVSDPAWGAALGERLVWMAKGDHQVAELKISPPNLGPLEVRLNINHDQASVSFVSHHAAVRDAIESAIPRLREMLAEQSINLVQADVGSGRQQDPGQHSGSASDGAAGMGALLSEDDSDLVVGGAMDEASASATQRGLGLLDLFA